MMIIRFAHSISFRHHAFHNLPHLAVGLEILHPFGSSLVQIPLRLMFNHAVFQQDREIFLELRIRQVCGVHYLGLSYAPIGGFEYLRNDISPTTIFHDG